MHKRLLSRLLNVMLLVVLVLPGSAIASYLSLALDSNSLSIVSWSMFCSTPK